jgi:hypothetical protein
MKGPGYYPGYSVLSQERFWDAATRKLILDRVANVPPIRFFSPEEARLLEAVCSHIIPQDDREPRARIPVMPQIDKRLAANKIPGYQFEDMPSDREAYRLGLQAIDQIAVHLHARTFVELEPLEQDLLLKLLHDGKPPAAHEIWKRMPVHRFWMLLVQDCIEGYYCHPASWDEIGYGGPAYPRGYMRLENGQPEPWEVDERRYEWKAPENSVSDRYEPVGGHPADQPVQGQEGTH